MKPFSIRTTPTHFLICLAGVFLAMSNDAPGAKGPLTDDDWASFSPAFYPFRFEHKESTIPHIFPCENGYFQLAVEAIGHLVPGLHAAKWDGQQWVPGDEWWDAYTSLHSNFFIGAEHYRTVAAGVGGLGDDSYRVVRRGEGDAPLGEAFNGAIDSIVAFEGELYASGEFTQVGEVPVNHIARWDGSSWCALGEGVDGEVGYLAMAGSDLYVTGSFTHAGGVPATHFAKWDGTAWSTVAPGLVAPDLGQSIAALAVHGSDIYAAVTFWTGSFAEVPPPSQLYRWHGLSWTPVGSKTSRSIYAVAVLGDDLYVGGEFDIAGGKASGNLAKVLLNGVPSLQKTGCRATAFFRGIPAGGYHVDRTTDFVTWENLEARYATDTGGIDFRDEAAPEARAFYRAVPMDP